MRVFGHYRNRREHRNAGLAHPDDVGAGAQYFDKSDQVIDEVVEVEPAISHPDIASVMPVGNVDVVVCQKCFGGPAQQGREVPGHRRHQENPWLNHLRILLEVEQSAKWGPMELHLTHCRHSSAGRDAVDPERRPAMAQPGTGDEFANSGDCSHKCVS
jgi:hypothetical protein